MTTDPNPVPKDRSSIRDVDMVQDGTTPSFARLPTSGSHRAEVMLAIYEGMAAAGIDFVVSLSDSDLDGLIPIIEERADMGFYVCSREDEGVAIAMGAYLTGKMPLILMGASSVGLSGLILAHGITMHTPVVMLISHSTTLGVRFDFLNSGRISAEPILRGLGIPVAEIATPDQIETVLVEARTTAASQQVPVAVFVPTHVLRE